MGSKTGKVGEQGGEIRISPTMGTGRSLVKQSDAKREVVLVSACLLGVRCRYDGTSNPASELLDRSDICVVPVCPEQLGGLPTPRPPAWFTGGTGEDVLEGRARVVNANGEDVTDRFLAGARQTLEIARLTGARRAILKEKSPSCGSCMVYCDGKRVAGQGVTAALLRRAGLEVLSLDPPKQGEATGAAVEPEHGTDAS